MQWHIKTQQEGLKLKCDYCNSYFTHKTNLWRHLDTIHPLAEKPKTMELMKVVKTEDDVKFKCQFCQQEFLRETSLKIHIGHAHSSSDAKTCKQCNRVFKTPGQLQTHVTNVHAKVKKWCEICQKHVSQAFFRMHNATVHNGKKAECQICHKSISYYNIRKHQTLCEKKALSLSEPKIKHSKTTIQPIEPNIPNTQEIKIVDSQLEVKINVPLPPPPTQGIELDEFDEILQDFEESEELLDDSYEIDEIGDSPISSVETVETHDILDVEDDDNDTEPSITLQIKME